MRFPSAHAGVKKIFIAEIIAIVASLMAIVVAILSAVANRNPENNPLVGVVGGLLIAVGVVSLVSLIIKMIGLMQAGKDEHSFRIGFWLIIMSIVLSVVSTILGSLNIANINVVVAILDAVVSVIEVVVLLYILTGISVLADQLGDSAMSSLGRKLMWVVVCLFLFSTILGMLGRFTWNDVAATIFGVLGIIAAVVELVAYIVTLVFYGKAVKMLER